MTTWRVACLSVLAVLLAACGGGGDADRPALSASTSAPASASTSGSASGTPAGPTASAFDLLHDSEAVGAFVVAFRTEFPALAAGRTDTVLRDDVTHVCVDDLPEGGDQLALSRIPARFADNGITPDQPTSTAIMALAKSTACGALPAR